ncbi:hypothetical protein [Paeniglutamicibacter terrestris]|uniref:Minor tail protein n=1 Tax=Paeniglutamicibacter terrestris TaxID=2723403 RepID=A0ABX1G5Y3_9MICC|nr:hypothetical protein [Paeniglutamicibacter terrestris]NKG21121.1 hypothetical protein [Paeniglutamicibacter terrestris]
MSFPSGILTSTLTASGGVIADGRAVEVRIWASLAQPVTHEPTGTPFLSGLVVTDWSADGAVMVLANDSQAGFVDAAGHSVTGWGYTVTVERRISKAGPMLPKRDLNISLAVGQVLVDLDLVPSVVSVPPVVGTVPFVSSINGASGAIVIDTTLEAHTHTIADTTGLQAALNAKAATVHTHTIANVTGLQGALDAKQASGDYATNTALAGKADTVHTHTIANVTGLQAAIDAAGGTPDWDDVADKPLTFTPTIGATSTTAVAGNDPRLTDSRTPLAHSHAIANVTGLQAAIDAKQATGDYATNTALTAGLATKAGTTHSHATSDVTGLDTALSGKAATSHTHTIANVTGLQGALDAKQASGDFATNTALTSGLATKAATSHAHATSDVTGLDTALSGKAATSHTHTASQVSDSTTVGRAVLTATDAAAVRTAIGAGTSNLALGTSSTTAAAGNDSRLSDARTPLTHSHTASQISDSTTVGRAVVVATDAAAARSAIGAGTGNGTSNLAIGTTGSTAKAGNYTPPIADLPAGVLLSVVYSAGWAARPTSRTDITVYWIGGTEGTPPSGMITNDIWTVNVA